MNPTSKNYKLFIFIVLCFGCGTNRKHSFESPAPNAFSHKDFEEIQIPGSKMFIQAPLDFKSVNGGLRRDSNTYIVVGPPEEIGMEKAAPGINLQFQQIHQDAYQGPLYYWAETEVGGRRSLVYYGVDSIKGRDKVWIFTGGHDHIYRITAVFPSDDAATADSMNFALHTLDEHPDAPYVPEDSIRYSLDLAYSGFWYDSNVKNVFYYSTTGHEHPAYQIMTDQFFVVVFPPINGSLEQMMGGVMAKFKDMNFHFPVYKINHKTVNGMDAYEVDCKTKFQGDDNSFYCLLTGTPARPLMLAGWTFENQEERIAGIRKVAQTLKLKP